MGRLRKLEPDAALFRRRAAGEPLRQLAADYGVAHTALSRFFVRPEAIRELRHAAELNEAQRRAAEARWRAERTAKRSRNQLPPAATASADQPLADRGAPAALPPPDPPTAARSPDRAHRRPAASRVDDRFSYTDWLDERDARTPAPPDRRVHLIDATGKRVGSTYQSNAQKAIAALQPQHGPLTIVDA